jgi:hypothetical protein
VVALFHTYVSARIDPAYWIQYVCPVPDWTVIGAVLWAPTLPGAVSAEWDCREHLLIYIRSQPSLGSSTAIFGLLGAEGIFLYRNREIFGSAAQRALTRIITIALINLVIGLSPGIDNWGHIGGLIGGTLFAWFAGPILKVEGVYPSLSVVDTRESREVMVTTMLLSAALVLLASGVIFLRVS